MFTTPARLQPLRRPITAAIAAALTAIALAQTATPAAAADRFWTCPPNYFTNPVCWSNPGPVLSSDNLLIRPNGPIQVEVNFPGAAANTALTVQSLTLNGGANNMFPTLNVTTGSLSMVADFKVGIDYAAVVRQSGGIVSSYSMQMNRRSNYLLSGGGLQSGSFSNAGSVLVNGTGFLFAGTMLNSGTLVINGGNAAATTDVSVNSGVMRLSGATYSANSASNEVGAQIIGASSAMSNLLQNNGIIQATGGTLALPTSGGRLASRGELRIENTATVSLSRGLVNEAGGVINLKGVDTGSGPQAILSNGNVGGTLTNSGTLQGAGFVAMPVDHRGRVSVGAGSTLTFNQSFASAAGSAMVSDGVLRFDGPASLHQGALISGAGATWFNNTLSVGAAGAAGLMKVTGNVVLGSTYFADILGTLAGVGHDQLVVGGQLALGQGSVLKLGSGSFVAQAGQSFKLFDWGTLQGVFLGVDASGMQLANGATLDMSRLYADGTLAVVAVPEPAAWALTIAGIAGLLARRRRGRQAQGPA